MKISDHMHGLLNEQINLELQSANQYLCKASHFFDHELEGFGHFFMVQADEEQLHARKLFTYLHDVGGRIRLKDFPAVQEQKQNHLEVLEEALAQEEQVTASINQLIGQALDEKDFATYTFLEWFVSEQVEEESTMRTLVAKLRMIGNDASALFFLNEELGKRQSPV